MRKNVFGRKFKRDKNERAAFFKGLISALVLNERITTTEARAKAIKGDADKVITKAKKNKEVAKRALAGLLNKEALEKLVNDLAPRFVSRKGGYTRIIRLGKRFGDDAMEVIIEWTEGPRAVTVADTRQPRVAEAARKSKVRSSRKTRSLSEARQLSSSKKSKNASRSSVAPRSGSRTSAKSKKKK